MMEMKLFISRQSKKKQISGDLGTEYAPDRKKTAEIPMREDVFCTLSDVQNIEHLVFFVLFEKPIFDVYQTPKWANSDRNSLMWLILNSDCSFEIFEKSFIPKPDMLKIHAHMKKVKKIEKFAFLPKNSISSL